MVGQRQHFWAVRNLFTPTRGDTALLTLTGNVLVMVTARSGGGKAPLAELVQQIGAIIAQGEDSGSQSQHTEVRSKLRAVLLKLLDSGAASPTAGTRELGAVLRLLNLALEKVPNWLTGDTSSLLLEVLDRLVPLMVRQLPPEVGADLVEALGRVLGRVAATDEPQSAALMAGFYDLLQGAHAVRCGRDGCAARRARG